MMKPDDDELINVDLEAEGPPSPPEAPVESMLEKEVKKPVENAKSNTKKMVFIAAGAAAVLALAIGLSVGLSSSSSTEAPTFNATLDTISSETIQQSYSTCEELRHDLVQASGFLANSVIDSNAEWYFHQEYRNRGSDRFGGPQILNSEIGRAHV